jgi:hypothetical protein
MTSGQDVSEYLDTLGLVKSYFSSFLEKKLKKKMSWSSDSPEDQTICLFTGLLPNPDVSLHPHSLSQTENVINIRKNTSPPVEFILELRQLKTKVN